MLPTTQRSIPVCPAWSCGSAASCLCWHRALAAKWDAGVLAKKRPAQCWEAKKNSEGLWCSISLRNLLVLLGHLSPCVLAVLHTLLVAINSFVFYFFPKQEPGARRKCPLKDFFRTSEPEQCGSRCWRCCLSASRAAVRLRAPSTVTNGYKPPSAIALRFLWLLSCWGLGSPEPSFLH